MKLHVPNHMYYAFGSNSDFGIQAFPNGELTSICRGPSAMVAVKATSTPRTTASGETLEGKLCPRMQSLHNKDCTHYPCLYIRARVGSVCQDFPAPSHVSGETINHNRNRCHFKKKHRDRPKISFDPQTRTARISGAENGHFPRLHF